MVSLLEQYETETSHQTSDYSEGNELNNPFRSGYIQTSTNDNEDIFKSQRVQISIQDRSIDQFEKCAGQMAILFKPKTIRLLHIENRLDETLESPEFVNRFFLDKTGKHLLVATETNELYYYSRQARKFKALNKIKGHLVTAVGWNPNSTDKSTEPILLGTKRGLIFETLINTNNEGLLNLSVDSYCKQLYNLSKDTPITGIEIFQFRRESSSASVSESVYDIVITIPTRLYEFIGNDSASLSYGSQSGSGGGGGSGGNAGGGFNSGIGSASGLGAIGSNLVSSSLLSTAPTFASIFAYYESKSIHELANYFEMPGDIGYSQLQIRNNPKTKKKALAWMTGGGVLTYELDLNSLAKFASNSSTSDSSAKRIISEANQEIISYPHVNDDSFTQDTQDLPIGISLTEFHLAIFYKLQVKIICILNKELVFNQKLDMKSIGGKTLGVWFDSFYGDFGSYTNKSIIKYLTNKESRRIWKIYLSKSEFDLAKQYCRDNPANMNTVLTRQAEHLFANKRYNESAICYAQTQNSFEEICLKYLELNDMNALRTFLVYKLKDLDPEKEITQTTVVIAYIIEIYLNQLADLMQDRLYDDHDALHTEFCKFLDTSQVKSCLKESKEAIYKIFASHGNVCDLVYFAEVMKDYPQIITHYLHEENYRKALEALAKQNDIEILYKYSPIFFELLPKEIVDLWIKLGTQANPCKLLPSLASCTLTDEQANESVRYLEHCVNRLDIRDQSVHNYMLSLYLQYKPEILLEYVKTRKDEKDVHFDILMIARLCSARDNVHLHEACVYLFKMMGWYEEAVDLALSSVNVDLARDVANSVCADINLSGGGTGLGYAGSDERADELRKMLWLRIARHVIEKENDVNRAMQFLHDLNETIVIEDVLPYFPDFVTIDQFKDAIRSSLAAYTEKISALKESIEQAAASAQLIRADIQHIRQRSITVNASDACSRCRYRLMSRRFYVFPCMHKFHSDCLYQTAQPYLLPAKQRRIEELQKLLQDIQSLPLAAPSAAAAPPAAASSSSLVGLSTANSLVNSVMTGVKSAASSASGSGGARSAAAAAAAAYHTPPQTYSIDEISRLKTELDDLLAAECPWCGERILKSIDEPFIDTMQYEAVFASWL